MMTLKQLVSTIGSPVVFNGIWHGVLKDVFVSPVTKKILVSVLYAKNPFKRQGAEVTPADLVEPSTWKALDEQVQHYREQLKSTLGELYGEL